MIRNLFLSSVIAVTCAAAAISPAYAGRLVIGIGSGYDEDYGDNYDYYPDRYPDYYGQSYSDNEYDMYDNGYRPRYYRHHRHHCHVGLIKQWRHHHRVIERVRICNR